LESRRLATRHLALHFGPKHLHVGVPHRPCPVRKQGYISDIRISPDGKFLAFMDHPVLGDNVGTVAIANQFGKRRTISPESWPKSWWEEGLAWAPSGKEVWFTNQTGLWASDLSGRTRSLLQMASLYLRDIGPDGSVLFYQFSGGTSMNLISWNKPFTRRDLSWLDLSYVSDVSQDGKLILFSETGIGGGPEYMMYMRKADGSPAVQLNPGRMGTISPDGQWAITVGFAMPLQLSLVPLHMGETRLLTNDSITHYEAHWMPDSTHFVFAGQEPGHGVRVYLQSIHDNSPKAITPEGCAPRAVSPDGKLIVAECVGKTTWKMYPGEGGQPLEPKGLVAGDSPLAWTNDHCLWVLNSWYVNSAQIFKVNPYTGSRESWKEIALDSFSGIHDAVITSDGNTFVHSDSANFGSLRRVYGLR
jgi:eukaryotic-like serine/threonine-protein kinase